MSVVCSMKLKWSFRLKLVPLPTRACVWGCGMLLFSPEAWWASLDPSMLLRHILVFKNALAFILENYLVDRYNPGVKNLLEALKLLYKVSASILLSSVSPVLWGHFALLRFVCCGDWRQKLVHGNFSSQKISFKNKRGPSIKVPVSCERHQTWTFFTPVKLTSF